LAVPSLLSVRASVGCVPPKLTVAPERTLSADAPAATLPLWLSVPKTSSAPAPASVPLRLRTAFAATLLAPASVNVCGPVSSVCALAPLPSVRLATRTSLLIVMV
jgi:hypothetical protein